MSWCGSTTRRRDRKRRSSGSPALSARPGARGLTETPVEPIEVRETREVAVTMNPNEIVTLLVRMMP